MSTHAKITPYTDRFNHTRYEWACDICLLYQDRFISPESARRSFSEHELFEHQSADAED